MGASRAGFGGVWGRLGASVEHSCSVATWGNGERMAWVTLWTESDPSHRVSDAHRGVRRGGKPPKSSYVWLETHFDLGVVRANGDTATRPGCTTRRVV